MSPPSGYSHVTDGPRQGHKTVDGRVVRTGPRRGDDSENEDKDRDDGYSDTSGDGYAPDDSDSDSDEEEYDSQDDSVSINDLQNRGPSNKGSRDKASSKNNNRNKARPENHNSGKIRPEKAKGDKARPEKGNGDKAPSDNKSPDDDTVGTGYPSSEGNTDYKCICDYNADDGDAVQCDRCHFWQHDLCYYPGWPKRPAKAPHKCHECLGKLARRRMKKLAEEKAANEKKTKDPNNRSRSPSNPDPDQFERPGSAQPPSNQRSSDQNRPSSKKRKIRDDGESAGANKKKKPDDSKHGTGHPSTGGKGLRAFGSKTTYGSNAAGPSTSNAGHGQFPQPESAPLLSNQTPSNQNQPSPKKSKQRTDDDAGIDERKKPKRSNKPKSGAIKSPITGKALRSTEWPAHLFQALGRFAIAEFDDKSVKRSQNARWKRIAEAFDTAFPHLFNGNIAGCSNSIQNRWNRYGRSMFNYDERTRKKNPSLVTSGQANRKKKTQEGNVATGQGNRKVAAGQGKGNLFAPGQGNGNIAPGQGKGNSAPGNIMPGNEQGDHGDDLTDHEDGETDHKGDGANYGNDETDHEHDETGHGDDQADYEDNQTDYDQTDYDDDSPQVKQEPEDDSDNDLQQTLYESITDAAHSLQRSDDNSNDPLANIQAQHQQDLNDHYLEQQRLNQQLQSTQPMQNPQPGQGFHPQQGFHQQQNLPQDQAPAGDAGSNEQAAGHTRNQRSAEDRSADTEYPELRYQQALLDAQPQHSSNNNDKGRGKQKAHDKGKGQATDEGHAKDSENDNSIGRQSSQLNANSNASIHQGMRPKSTYVPRTFVPQFSHLSSLEHNLHDQNQLALQRGIMQSLLPSNRATNQGSGPRQAPRNASSSSNLTRDRDPDSERRFRELLFPPNNAGNQAQQNTSSSSNSLGDQASALQSIMREEQSAGNQAQQNASSSSNPLGDQGFAAQQAPQNSQGHQSFTPNPDYEPSFFNDWMGYPED